MPRVTENIQPPKPFVIYQDTNKEALDDILHRLESLEDRVTQLNQALSKNKNKSKRDQSLVTNSATKRKNEELAIEFEGSSLTNEFYEDHHSGTTYSLPISHSLTTFHRPSLPILSQDFPWRRIQIFQSKRRYHAHVINFLSWIERSNPRNVLTPILTKDWSVIANFDQTLRIAALNTSILCPRSKKHF